MNSKFGSLAIGDIMSIEAIPGSINLIKIRNNTSYENSSCLPLPLRRPNAISLNNGHYAVIGDEMSIYKKKSLSSSPPWIIDSDDEIDGIAFKDLNIGDTFRLNTKIRRNYQYYNFLFVKLSDCYDADEPRGSRRADAYCIDCDGYVWIDSNSKVERQKDITDDKYIGFEKEVEDAR